MPIIRHLAGSAPTAAAFAIAIGLGLITVDQFLFAEVGFVVAALWGVLWLIFQPFRGEKFESAFLLVIAVITAGLIYSTDRYKTKKILAENHGLLLPDDDLDPGCDPNLKTVLLGNAAFATDTFPHPVLRIFDRQTQIVVPVLTLDIKDGRLAVSATISSEDGKFIVSLIDNQWTVNPNNIMIKENDDIHSLSVIDQYNEEALYARFKNQNVIELRMNLNYKGQHFKIDKEGIHIPGVWGGISGVCAIVLGTGAAFLELD